MQEHRARLFFYSFKHRSTSGGRDCLKNRIEGGHNGIRLLNGNNLTVTLSKNLDLFCAFQRFPRLRGMEYRNEKGVTFFLLKNVTLSRLYWKISHGRRSCVLSLETRRYVSCQPTPSECFSEKEAFPDIERRILSTCRITAKNLSNKSENNMCRKTVKITFVGKLWI